MPAFAIFHCQHNLNHIYMRSDNYVSNFILSIKTEQKLTQSLEAALLAEPDSCILCFCFYAMPPWNITWSCPRDHRPLRVKTKVPSGTGDASSMQQKVLKAYQMPKYNWDRILELWKHSLHLSVLSALWVSRKSTSDRLRYIGKNIRKCWVNKAASSHTRGQAIIPTGTFWAGACTSSAAVNSHAFDLYW